eukprot:CFRG5381T1
MTPSNNVDSVLYTAPHSRNIPLLEDVDSEIASIAQKSIPSIPFSVDLYGVPMVNDRFPLVDEINAATLAGLAQHNAPVTLNGVTKPAAGYTFDSTPLESYEQYGDIAYPPGWLDDPALQSYVNDSMKTFVDSAYSEDAFLNDLADLAILNMPWLLVKITSINIPKYSEVFPDVDLDEVGSDYYMLDSSILGSHPTELSRKKEGLVLYSVGAAVLLRMQKSPYSSCRRSCDGKLIPTDIRILMRSNDDSISIPNSRLFSKRTSTDSAWRMALLAARCSMVQWGILVGHVHALHGVPATLQRSFYLNLAPDHELRAILEPFLRYTIQNVAFFITGDITLNALPYIEVGALIPIWTAQYTNEPYRDMLPSVYLPKHGLLEEDFTVSQPWDALPAINHYIELENIAADFVDAIITASPYRTDQNVADDVQLQAMLNDLMSEEGGRLGALVHSSASIQTVKDLRRVLTTYFYLSFLHGHGRLTTFSFSGLFIPKTILSFLSDDFMYHDDTVKNYTKTEFLAHLPNAAIAVETVIFAEFFIYNPPYAPLVKANDNGTVRSSIESVYSLDLQAQLSESSLITLQNGLDKLSSDILELIEVSLETSGIAVVDSLTQLKNFPLSAEV